MLDGANKLVGKVLKSAEVATLIPANPPVEAIAVGGMLPGLNTY